MRYDLKTPCKNCPFRKDDTGIRFADPIRAIQIYLGAEHDGFPCHLSAELREDDEEGLGGGYHQTEESQHCVGFIIMKLKEFSDFPWAGGRP